MAVVPAAPVTRRGVPFVDGFDIRDLTEPSARTRKDSPKAERKEMCPREIRGQPPCLQSGIRSRIGSRQTLATLTPATSSGSGPPTPQSSACPGAGPARTVSQPPPLHERARPLGAAPKAARRPCGRLASPWRVPHHSVPEDEHARVK